MWTAIGSSTQSRVRQNNRKRRPTGVSHSNQPHASFQHGSFGDSRPSITRAGSYSPTAGHHAGGEHALVGSNIAYQHAIQHGAQHRQLNALGVSSRRLPQAHGKIISSTSGSGESSPSGSDRLPSGPYSHGQLAAARASMHRRVASTPIGVGRQGSGSPDHDNHSFAMSTSTSLQSGEVPDSRDQGDGTPPQHHDGGRSTSMQSSNVFSFDSPPDGGGGYPSGPSVPPYVTDPQGAGQWAGDTPGMAASDGMFYAGFAGVPSTAAAGQHAAWNGATPPVVSDASGALHVAWSPQTATPVAGGGLLEFEVDPATLKALGLKNLVARRRRRASDDWEGGAGGGAGGGSGGDSSGEEEVVSTTTSSGSGSDSSSSDESVWEEGLGPGGVVRKSMKTYFSRRFARGGDERELDNTRPVTLLNGTRIVPSTFGQLLRTSDGIDELALPEVMLARTDSGQLVTVNHRTGQVRLFGESDPAKELSAAERERFQEMAGDEEETLPSIFAAFETKPNGVQSSSQFILELPQRMRNSARSLVHNVWFDRVVLAVIMVNCVFLALDEPGLDRDSQLASTLRGADVFFTVFFILEMSVKMVALGVNFNQEHSYFRSAWNCLDFFIVVESIISLMRVIEIGNFSALRAVRALRPLRTINRLQGLQVLVNSLLHSLPLLCNTLLFIAFYFVVFGIIGLDLWAGVLHQRCYVLATGLPDPDDDRLCGGMHQCMEGSFCGIAEDAPNNDVTSFDNIFLAFVAIFQAITLEGWTNMMYQTQDSFHEWAWMYWIPLVLVGSFILLNLTLAVILAKFHEAQELQRRNRMQRHAVAKARQKALMADRRAKAKEANRYAIKHTRSNASRTSSNNSSRFRALSGAALLQSRLAAGVGGKPMSPFNMASVQHLSTTASIRSDDSSQHNSVNSGMASNPLQTPPGMHHETPDSKATLPQMPAQQQPTGTPKGGLRGGMMPRSRRKSSVDEPQGAATLLGNRRRRGSIVRTLPAPAPPGTVVPLPQLSPHLSANAQSPAVAAAALGLSPFRQTPPSQLPPYMSPPAAGDSKHAPPSPALQRSATSAPGHMAAHTGALGSDVSPSRSHTVMARGGAAQHDGTSFSARADAYKRHQEKALLKARRASMANFQSPELDLRRRKSTWGTFAFESATAAAEAKLRAKAEADARKAAKKGKSGKHRRASVAVGHNVHRTSEFGAPSGGHRRAATAGVPPNLGGLLEGDEGGQDERAQASADAPGPFRRMGALDSVHDPHDTVVPALHRGGRIRAGSKHNRSAATMSTTGSDDEVLGASAADRWEADHGSRGQQSGSAKGASRDDFDVGGTGRPRLQRHLSSKKLRRSSTLAMVNIHSGGEEGNEAHRGGKRTLQRSHTMLPGSMVSDSVRHTPAQDGSGRSNQQRAMMTAAAHAAAMAAQRRQQREAESDDEDTAEAASESRDSSANDGEYGSDDGADSEALEGGTDDAEDLPGPGVLSVLCCCGGDDETLTGYNDFPHKRPRVGQAAIAGRTRNRCQRFIARLTALPGKLAACCSRCAEPADADDVPRNVQRMRADPNAPRYFKLHPWEVVLQGNSDDESRLNCSWCEQAQDYFCPRGTKSQLRFQAAISAPLEGFITSRLFVLTVGVCIFLNTVALAIEHHNMPVLLADLLNVMNIVFTSVFALEMLLKWLGLGFARYFEDKFNIFDSIIVLVSLVELALDRGSGEGGTFAAFRMARVFRVVRLTRQWSSMKRIVNVVTRSLESFGYLMLLLLLFQFVFALMAMHLMGGIYQHLPEHERPRSNFDTLHNSFISVFQILAGEAWNEVMYEVVGATNQKAYIAFFVSWTIIGQFLLLELFLAVLLDAFSGNDMNTTKREQQDIQHAASEMVKATMKAKRMRQARSHSVRDKVLFASAIQQRIGERRRNNNLRKQILFGSAPDLDATSGTAGTHTMRLLPTGSMQPRRTLPPPKSKKAFSALRNFMLQSSTAEKEAIAAAAAAKARQELPAPARRSRVPPPAPPSLRRQPPSAPPGGAAASSGHTNQRAVGALKRFLLNASSEQKAAVANSMPTPAGSSPPNAGAAPPHQLAGSVLAPVAERTASGTSTSASKDSAVNGLAGTSPQSKQRRGTLGLGDLVDQRLTSRSISHDSDNSSRASSTTSSSTHDAGVADVEGMHTQPARLERCTSRAKWQALGLVGPSQQESSAGGAADKRDKAAFVHRRASLLRDVSPSKRKSVALFAGALDDSFLTETRASHGSDEGEEAVPGDNCGFDAEQPQVFAGASAFVRSSFMHTAPSAASSDPPPADMPSTRSAVRPRHDSVDKYVSMVRTQLPFAEESAQAAALVDMPSPVQSSGGTGATGRRRKQRRSSAPTLSSSQWARLDDWSRAMEAAAAQAGLASSPPPTSLAAAGAISAPAPSNTAATPGAIGATEGHQRRSSRFGPATREDLQRLRSASNSSPVANAASSAQAPMLEGQSGLPPPAPAQGDDRGRQARLAGLRGAIRFVQSAKIIKSERVPPPAAAGPDSPPPRKAMKLKILRSPLPKPGKAPSQQVAEAPDQPPLKTSRSSPPPPSSPKTKSPPAAPRRRSASDQSPLSNFEEGQVTPGLQAFQDLQQVAPSPAVRPPPVVGTALAPISEQGSTAWNTTSSVGQSSAGSTPRSKRSGSSRAGMRRSFSARHSRRVSFAGQQAATPSALETNPLTSPATPSAQTSPTSPVSSSGSSIATRAGVMSAALAHDEHGRLRDVHHETRSGDNAARLRTANKRAAFAAKGGGVGASDGAMVVARDRRHFEHVSDRSIGVQQNTDSGCMSRHLFLLKPGSRMQQALAKFIDQNTTLFTVRLPNMCGLKGATQAVTFDGLVLVLIVLSSLLLALEEPNLDKQSTEFQVLRIFDIIFTSLFVSEILLKSAAYGFCLTPSAYVKDKWNLIDLFSVIASLVGLLVTSADISYVRVLRLVRCLRPLRLISRNQGMKVVVEALIRSIGAILNVTGVLLLVWFLFGVLGVQLFAGKLAFCNDPDFPPGAPFAGVPDGTGGWEIEPCSSDFTYFDEESAGTEPREVITPEANFDNIFNAMLTLFITSSGEGWPSTMYQVSDVTAVDHQPRRGNSKENAYYFVLFIFVGSFFLVNLFIGVVFDEFVATKTDLEGFGFLTERQREWVETQRLLQRAKPISQAKAPRRGVRRTLYSIVNSALFSWLVSGCIMLNIVVLAASFWRQPQEYEDGLLYTNVAFSFVFALEAFMKVVGLGWKKYAQSTWNQFDFVIAAAGILDSALINAEGDIVAWVQRTLSVIRVLRGVRLFKTFTGLRTIMGTILIALPSLGNVAALLLLIFFIYAVAGMTVFGQVDLQENLNVHANFQDFALAFGTLFRCATGEGWEGIMFDTMNTDAGGTAAAPIYYITFIVVVTYVMLSLFSLIVVEQYSQQDRQARGLTGEHIRQYRRAWAQVDRTGHKWIPVNKVERLLRILPRPMGLRKDATFAEYLEYATRLDVVAWNGKVHFRDLLLALHRVTYGVAIPSSVLTRMETAPDKVQGRIEEKLRLEMENEARRVAAAANRGASRFMHALAQRTAAARQRRKSVHDPLATPGPTSGNPKSPSDKRLGRDADSVVRDIVTGNGGFDGAQASMAAGLSPQLGPQMESKRAAPALEANAEHHDSEAAANEARIARLRAIFGGGASGKPAPKMLNVVSSAVSQRRMIKAAALGMSEPEDRSSAGSDSDDPQLDPDHDQRVVSGILNAATGGSSRNLGQAAVDPDPRRQSLVEQIGSNPLQVARKRMNAVPEGHTVEPDSAQVASAWSTAAAGAAHSQSTEGVSGRGWAVLRPRGAGTSRRLRALSVTKANFELELTASKIQSAWRARLKYRQNRDKKTRSKAAAKLHF